MCYDPEGNQGHNNIKYVVKCLRTASDSYWNKHGKKITHSTEPLEDYARADGKTIKVYVQVKPFHLYEVKKLLGEVDVEKKAEYDWMLHTEGSIVVTDNNDWKSGFHHGYNQALEDNKERKYTEDDIYKAIQYGREVHYTNDQPFIQSLQPKTEWNVEFDEHGKLKLK